MTMTISKSQMKRKIKTKLKSKKSKILSKKKNKKVNLVYKVKVDKKKNVKSVSKTEDIENIFVRRQIDIPQTNVDKNVDKSLEKEDVITDGSDKTRVRRRGRNKKEKIYFSKATEDAIVEYNSEIEFEKRNKIYNEKIKFSFEKLVENIFNTFKFTYFDTSPIEIQRETVSHLVANIHKFKVGKGKAFSYFSIVAKNYLIFHNNTNYKRFNQHVDISETPSESSVCLQTEDPHHKNVQMNEFMKLLIDYWEKNITKIFTKSKDLNIAYAVIELFRNCDRIESFNKKTLYLYIREISNCKTQQITKVLNKMKSYQSVVSKNYSNRGIF